MSVHPPRRRWSARGLALLGPVALVVTTLAGADLPGVGAEPGSPPVVLQREPGEEPMVVDVLLDDTAEMDRLVATGVDLDHGVERTPDGLKVRAVVTDSEIATLKKAGYEFGEVLYTADDSAAALAGREATIAADSAANRAVARGAKTGLRALPGSTPADSSDVRIIRADYYTSFGVGVLSVEAKLLPASTTSPPLTVQRDSGPGTPMGSGGTQTVSRFVDAGVYLYHLGATNVNVDVRGESVRPDRIQITSPSGDVAIAKVNDWLPTGTEDDPFKGAGYQEDFISKYLVPTELYQRVEQLAATYPDLAEVVTLPNASQGYRRKAQAMLEPTNRLTATISGQDVDLPYAAATSGAWATLAPTAGTTPSAVAVRRVSAAANPAWPAATPAMGCGTLSGLTGAIAVIDRGECSLADKVLNAQNAGAVAVALVNATTGLASAPSGSATPTGGSTAVTLPTVGISLMDATRIRNGGSTVTGRLVPAAVVPNSSRIGVESLAWGHEGGNDVTVQVVDPAAPDAPLSVSVTGTAITVSAATDGAGAIVSTATQVIAALLAEPAAAALVDAYPYRTETGSGVVRATPVVRLSDNLNAPAWVSRDPHPVYALKIGKTRNGSKPGVLAYAQEHAREWVPPLVTLEAAERLLRNYATHAPTRELVDNLEIWIAPSINPDGGHYSFFDFASQRRNMTRHCVKGGVYDATGRNSWGVDLNRNFTEYSAHDGYSGASATNCTSDTYAGPTELSEPEARNVDWMMARPNMRYSMNMHSSGDYFMWAPGSYKDAGRETAPRPSVGEEAYFWQASNRILTAIKRERGMTVTPARTGPIIDVLYSAAGNSGDLAWYKYGLYGWNFEVGRTFQPPFESLTPTGPGAHQEAMEYANGLVELLRVARDHDVDVTAPKTALEFVETSDPEQVEFVFTSDEAVEIFYTLDGTVPTTSTATEWKSAGDREGGERVRVPKGTRVLWYAVDAAGNVEAGYDPTRTDGRGYRKWIADPAWEPEAATPEVRLTVSPTSLQQGRTATATVAVTAENDFDLAPSGTVTVRAGGVAVGEIVLGADGTGRGTVGPFTTAGSIPVTASYAGDDLTAAGTSAAVPVRVVAAPVAKVASQTRVLKVRPKAVTRTTRPRLTVEVTASRPVTGPVVVRSGGKVVGRGTVTANGRLVVRLAKLGRPGRKVLAVRYLGNAQVKASATRVVVRVRR
ncbi:Chitobiase/beta-hexosaminidase C-terminal domain-containing protein [Nocardioides lianchengensis]|uniref:Chitobiase/beta-hexosaminidase C-terminal domain-containing protein n=1 Tax=Nocardioides lianchengensis TaxID=1045774 RepID=A0A1G6SNK5_9ACTN|nr:Chitobiase/beta-hexosaminidase C-terminal domain-containing protein [Nocardioides lianchengensis]